MKQPKKNHYLEEDVLLVHKPVGISSFGLIAKLRRILGTRKIGHAGTLDPLAHGLMIVGINKGTKKLESYIKKEKTYIAKIILGRSTTTGDQEGDIVQEKIPYRADVTMKNMEHALAGLIGEHHYPAPLYSAVKVQGRALYDYARKGDTPPYIPEKKMNLLSAYITDKYKRGDVYIITMRARVGSGTYIRTLAEEFGKKLGYPASLESLYRVSIDVYQDTDSFKISENKSLPTSFRDIMRGVFGNKK